MPAAIQQNAVFPIEVRVNIYKYLLTKKLLRIRLLCRREHKALKDSKIIQKGKNIDIDFFKEEVIK